MIQTLEARRLLSVSFSNGIIKVVTGDRKDVILTQNVGASRFSLNVNGEVRVFTNAAVSYLDIRTGDSADRVDLTGLKVRSRINAGRGSDTLLGGRRTDSLNGGGGSDRMFGNEDADRLEGGVLADTLDGGIGDDRLIPFSTPEYDDSVFGGQGNDTVDYSMEEKDLTLQFRDDGDEPTEIVTDEIAGDVEVVLGGSGDDRMTSFLSTEITLLGGAGNDTLIGSTNSDRLEGGPGADSLIGNAGNDTFVLGAVDNVKDVVDGGTDVDSIIGSGNDVLDDITNVP